MVTVAERIQFHRDIISASKIIVETAQQKIRELEDQSKQLVDVTFIGDRFNRTYTYIDTASDLTVGDLLLAGYKDGPAQVIRVRPYTSGAGIMHKPLSKSCKIQLPLDWGL